ncbi:MAG: hypothetical protein BWX92_03889 [Deltaproteobacteria bacterium ADurb.Bin135]|nr:MAG: hypothetical protein BWX92_03889 [Deltaproteobacteria bacterium ADurb.Bin135]
MSKIVSGIIDKLDNKPEYLVSTGGRVSLTFNNEQALQDFVMEIRKEGITYGIELAQLKDGNGNG